MGAHASTLEMELMHEAEKQGAMHHFSSELSPAEPQSRPGRRQGSRSPARKANEFGFLARTMVRSEQKTQPGGLFGLRTIPRNPNEIGFDTQTSGRKF